jgi:adenylylsulfate kinase
MKQDAQNRNIVWHHHQVTKADRTKLYGHGGAILWFTGLSGSGKSTLANAVESVLFERRLHSFILDGDNIRHGLNKDLGFSPKDREENIRRIGEVAHLFAQAGLIAMTAFISPYKSDRQKVRALAAPGEFIEIYVKCSLDTCEKRDTKGLYKKARAGQIPEFTGISAPYEEPEAAELVLNTDQETLEESAAKVVAYLESQGIVPKK